MLFTPEMSDMLDRDRERALGTARHEEEDVVLAAVRERGGARAGSGSIWGRSRCAASGDKLVNRGFVIDAGGEIRARYDKIHLFDVDLPTGESWRESALYEAGDEAVVVRDTPRRHAGADDLLRPALPGAVRAAVRGRGRRHRGARGVHRADRARRIGRCCCARGRSRPKLFVVAAAQAGRHEDGRETYGHAWSPIRGARCWSRWATSRGWRSSSSTSTRIAEVRARIPVLAHRRRRSGELIKRGAAP